MPESGPFGSGRGVSGNGHPYRDHSRLAVVRAQNRAVSRRTQRPMSR